MFRCLVSLFVLTFAGCERTRSFLQLNSDNPSPFLGLQFSVDSGHRPDEDVTLRTVSRTGNLFAPLRAADVVNLREHDGTDFRVQRETGDMETGDSNRTAKFSGSSVTEDRLRYAIPVTGLDDTTVDVSAEARHWVSRIGG